MDAVEKAMATQLANIQKKTGRTLEELSAVLRASGLTAHGELRAFAQKEFGLGYGDANTLVHTVRQPAAPQATDPLSEIYSGAKAWMRPIHEAIVAGISGYGEYENAPKKGYVSLRRKKQFAMLGPANNTQFEVGLNWKDAPAGGRLEALPPKGMCSHRVRLKDASEVDAELLGWIKEAFDRAG